MPKRTRPTEDAAFSSDEEEAGRQLCELVLGIDYRPAVAEYYAAAIKRRDNDQIEARKWRYIAIFGLEYVAELCNIILR